MVARLFGQDRATARANSTRVLGQLGLVGAPRLLLLDEADRLADQIVIIDHGKAIAHGTPAELKRRTGRSVIEVHVRDRGDVAEVARALAGIGDGQVQVDASTQRVTVVVGGGAEQLNRVLLPLEQRAIALEEVALRQPRLDEAFLALTGQAPHEAPAGDLVA